jgi:hypothetical protein
VRLIGVMGGGIANDPNAQANIAAFPPAVGLFAAKRRATPLAPSGRLPHVVERTVSSLLDTIGGLTLQRAAVTDG